MPEKKIHPISFELFTARELQHSIRPERWSRAELAQLVMMFPEPDGASYVRTLPNVPEFLRGSMVHSYRLGDHIGSIVSLLFYGRLQEFYGRWHIVNWTLGGKRIPVHSAADICLLRTEPPDDVLLSYLAQYVSQYPPSVLV